MHARQWTLHVEPQAPAKPAWGAPCNGCGICCLVAPCPLGMLVSRRRSGACNALQWQDRPAAYRCGLVHASPATVRVLLPAPVRWLAPVLAPVLRRLAPRWIAAGSGCDSNLQVDTLATMAPEGRSPIRNPTDP